MGIKTDRFADKLQRFDDHTKALHKGKKDVFTLAARGLAHTGHLAVRLLDKRDGGNAAPRRQPPVVPEKTSEASQTAHPAPFVSDVLNGWTSPARTSSQNQSTKTSSINKSVRFEDTPAVIPTRPTPGSVNMPRNPVRESAASGGNADARRRSPAARSSDPSAPDAPSEKRQPPKLKPKPTFLASAENGAAPQTRTKPPGLSGKPLSGSGTNSSRTPPSVKPKQAGLTEAAQGQRPSKAATFGRPELPPRPTGNVFGTSRAAPTDLQRSRRLDISMAEIQSDLAELEKTFAPYAGSLDPEELNRTVQAMMNDTAALQVARGFSRQDLLKRAKDTGLDKLVTLLKSSNAIEAFKNARTSPPDWAR